MKVIRDISDIDYNKIAAGIGFFDGVHLGHHFLINDIKSKAAERNLPSAVITFKVHPRKVLNSIFCPNLITSYDEKTELLAQSGIDYCIILDFTAELAKYTASEFMSKILHDIYKVNCLVIGYDHRFGRNRNEGFEEYVKYGNQLGIEVIQSSALLIDSINISSSLIRKYLSEGKMKEASKLLNYNYFIKGTVVSGFKIGREIGFPTANISISNKEKLLPRCGVYAVYITYAGNRYPAMLNIGNRPTVHEKGKTTIEAHIIGFSGNLYNKSIFVEFVDYIRDERRMDSLDDLKQQLEKDKEQTLALLL